jgi:hypothetical protein
MLTYAIGFSGMIGSISFHFLQTDRDPAEPMLD